VPQLQHGEEMSSPLVIGLIFAAVIDFRMAQHLSQSTIRLRHDFVNVGQANRKILSVDRAKVLYAEVDVEVVLL
jgi:hypothetical protein